MVWCSNSYLYPAMPRVICIDKRGVSHRPMKILLVDADEALTTALARSLTTQNFVVDAVPDGEMGWSYGSTFDYDLVILDLALPKLDGISLCKRFRAEDYTMPILLLAAEDNSTAKIQGLDAGADDYVVKPFDWAELLARIRALLRRGSTNPLPLLIWRDLLLNPTTCEVSYDGHPLSLTRKEYELLELFLRDTQHMFSTEEILDRLWSSEEFPSEATVRSHIRRVRHKLTAAGAPADFIATLHGRGYYLKPDESETADAFPWSHQASSRQEPGGSHRSPQASNPASRQDTWNLATQPKALEYVQTLAQMVEAVEGSFTVATQAQAKQIAHELANTLGTVGLQKAMHLARHLESWIGSPESLQFHNPDLMLPLVTALHDEIQNATVMQEDANSHGQAPLLLMVGLDTSLAEAIAPLADAQNLRTVILPTANSAAPWLTPEAIANLPIKPPDVLLVQLPAESSIPEQIQSRRAVLAMLHSFAQRFPTLPILVVGERDTLGDRLEAVRQGCDLFLSATTPPEQLLDTVGRYLDPGEPLAKVMILDSDRDWLRALPTLLKPWGFKVTTLDDPHQLWPVLQAVVPDVLVLNEQLPQVSSYELCQVLRCDPQWRRLPIVFLSSLTDLKTQNQAFAAGADDFLSKPINGAELANRLLSRLHRLRAYLHG